MVTTQHARFASTTQPVVRICARSASGYRVNLGASHERTASRIERNPDPIGNGR